MRFRPALALAALCLLAACKTSPAGSQPAQLFGVLDLSIAKERGGLSALAMSEAGTRMTAISDRGEVLQARVLREDGRIAGLDAITGFALRGADGAPLAGRHSDSEGLAVGADGTLHISFERTHSLRSFGAGGALLDETPGPEYFRYLQPNRSLEALAMDADGTLYTLPENPPSLRRGFPLFTVRGGVWRRIAYLPAQGFFSAVGADFGPDGRFYLLERRLTPLGFQSRVRSWRLRGETAEDETEILRTGPGTFGNLEGLSVWRSGPGRIVLTMVSDDNRMTYMRTQLVEYELAERLAPSAQSE